MLQFDRRDYFMGRDKAYPDDLTPEIDANADITIERANRLLTDAQADGVVLEKSPKTSSIVTSGWRPPAVNRNVPGAAPRSKHMTGQAVDIFDPEGDLDNWAMNHLERLEAVGLWLEHPSATKNWCHLQTVAPRSGVRVFFP